MPVVALPLPNRVLLQELFRYDPDTGCLTRLRTSGGQVAGQIAGWRTSSGHMAVRVGGQSYKAHRVIWKMMTGEEPPEIDHRDMDGANNRWQNLRAADRASNMANRRALRNNTSGFKGVCFHRRQKAWCASICVNGKQIYLGGFATPEAASAAYNAAQTVHRGEFARAA